MRGTAQGLSSPGATRVRTRGTTRWKLWFRCWPLAGDTGNVEGVETEHVTWWVGVDRRSIRAAAWTGPIC